MSVAHSRKMCQNGSTDKDDVWDLYAGGYKEPCVSSRHGSLQGESNFAGGMGAPCDATSRQNSLTTCRSAHAAVT